MHRKRRNSNKFKDSSTGKLILFLSLTAIFVGAWTLWAGDNVDATQTTNVHTPNEELLKVTTNPSLAEQIVEYPGMTVSFNRDKHIPNYVAWELTAEETLGDVQRQNSFHKDESVDGCPETFDYSYSGYDRGHMAPAGDMKWDKDAMNASFSLANICPQVKSLNTGSWKRLEEKCRQWAQADSSIIIICGPVLTDNIREFIGDSRVAVPKRFFKVILSPTSKPMRGIGFIMPNDKFEGGMQVAAVSIDSVEAVTGHDFFAALPDDVEQAVEKQCDFHYWSTLKKKKK